MTAVLAVVDELRGELRDVSFELITLGRELAGGSGGELHVAVPSGSERVAGDVDRVGVDAIHVPDAPGGYDPFAYASFVERLYEETDPSLVLIPHSTNGIDYAPAVADRLDLPILTDVNHVEVDGTITVGRKMYQSKVDARLETGRAAVLTVGEHEWPPTTGDGDAEVVSHESAADGPLPGLKVKGYEETEEGELDITDAEFIVGVGRGIEEEENLDLVRELCEATGATLACSRPLVEHGWLPWSRQVGKSGHTVAPKVYVAIGISGAIEHLVGMKGSQTVVAINSDPNAPIFELADYGIVGDLFDVVPELIEQFE